MEKEIKEVDQAEYIELLRGNRWVPTTKSVCRICQCISDWFVFPLIEGHVTEMCPECWELVKSYECAKKRNRELPPSEIKTIPIEYAEPKQLPPKPSVHTLICNEQTLFDVFGYPFEDLDGETREYVMLEGITLDDLKEHFPIKNTMSDNEADDLIKSIEEACTLDESKVGE